MLMIPAIDLKGGCCVRLRQGRMDDDTVFSADPVAMAQRWREAGARRLHLVDLDGAVAGHPLHDRVIAAIAEACPDLPLQVGGGIRTLETLRAYLGTGVQWAIIGTQAVRDPDFVAAASAQFPGRVIVGLDAYDGRVAIEGWSETADLEAESFARGFADGLVVNPGSVGQPRDDDPTAAYAVLDLETTALHLRRVEYPVAEVKQAIRRRGLPDELADRLG